MKAAIITIGDEILIGQIVDTNSAYLAKKLDQLGFQVVSALTIGDNKEAIEGALLNYLGKVDVVIMTGGLGPTKDDITKKVFCDFFDDYLVCNQKVLDHITIMLERIFNKPISEINKQQAFVPSKAHVLFNEVGTAAGMLMNKNNTLFVSLPGVPFEMKHIVEEQLAPYLNSKFYSNINVHKVIITYGIGESLLAEYLEDWENNLPEDIHLAYLPSPGRVRLRLSVKGDNREVLEKRIAELIKKIPKTVIPYIRAYEDVDLSQIVIKELQNQNKTISFAESCTGGRFSVMFNSLPGSSSYFKGGIIPYASQAKIDVLGVDEKLIEKYSVVSEQVAIEMARVARDKFKSDYAISTTGNAGPTKGDSEEDLGTVYIGIASSEGVYAKKFSLGQPREKVINGAISKGLELIYNDILKK
ncbi:competence/damage-inducible protein A [Myroides injenensis]|uniref:competence/damage-inducible protein A n=1 Tax=Myroides injenensis TaxID=1183151 RepID=UPI00028A26C9|nr:competence/damage-inducible protein A [Myroides injenensis]